MATNLIPGSNEWGANDVKTSGWLDDTDGVVHFHSEQDVGDIIRGNLEHKKEFAIQKNSAVGRFGEFCKVASIPNIVVDDLIRNGIWGDKKALKKWLNESEQTPFRTTRTWL